MTRLAILMLGLALAGCATSPAVELQTVNIAVPVVSQEPMPERPTMPTEQLALGTDAFELLRAALAEIDRREGYEVKLRAALANCTRPLAK